MTYEQTELLGRLAKMHEECGGAIRDVMAENVRLKAERAAVRSLSARHQTVLENLATGDATTVQEAVSIHSALWCIGELEANLREAEARPKQPDESEPAFQERVRAWTVGCFGEAIAADRTERNDRFVEEALELVQSLGATRADCHRLVDYVFGRPAGNPHQEVGGVMVTLAALCNANGIDMEDAAEDELARCWEKIEKIRAKQAAKPKGSPLPSVVDPDMPRRFSYLAGSGEKQWGAYWPKRNFYVCENRDFGRDFGPGFPPEQSYRSQEWPDGKPEPPTP